MIYNTPRQYLHSSRYGKYRQVMDKSVYLETFNQTYIPKSDEDRFHTVLPEQENRLDMIANIYYKDASMSWAIMLANDLIDPFIVVPGTILRIPPLISLYQLRGALYKNG